MKRNFDELQVKFKLLLNELAQLKHLQNPPSQPLRLLRDVLFDCLTTRQSRGGAAASPLKTCEHLPPIRDFWTELSGSYTFSYTFTFGVCGRFPFGKGGLDGLVFIYLGEQLLASIRQKTVAPDHRRDVPIQKSFTTRFTSVSANKLSKKQWGRWLDFFALKPARVPANENQSPNFPVG